MKLPVLPKRKAATISNGIFLILLGLLFYTDQWWPGILFALGASYAVRELLSGRRVELLIALVFLALVAVFSLTGHIFSVPIPILLAAAGFIIIIKECIHFPRDENDESIDT